MTVEIIGRAVRAPSASNVDQLFDLLKNEICAISSIPDDRWGKARFWHPVAGTSGKAYTFAAGVIDEIHTFDPAAFGLTAREAMYMDPQQRILLELVLEALEDASLPVAELQKERVGVYVGASSLDNANMYLEDPASGSPYFMTGNTLSIIANRVSHVFGLSGPSLTIDTACSSSLVALDQAVRALDRGEIDTAIVGGISILAHPFSFVGFSQARMLSPEGLCRAFSREANGYVRAEGGGAIVLRKTAAALAKADRSHAKIVATGLNSAGRTNGISLPSRKSQASLLRTVYAAYGIDPNDLAFIEAHGTGTKVGDPAEIWAIGTELGLKRKESLPVGSIKTNVGHSEPASGMFGLMKAMLALEHDFLPASLHAEELNEEIDFDSLNVHVNREGCFLARGEHKRLAGVNSFGFGGTNAHIVISDPDSLVRNRFAAPDVFMISAHTERALSQLMQDYAAQMKSRTAEADDIVAAAIGNRTPYKYRFAVGSNDPTVVLHNIEADLNADASASGHRGEAPATHASIAFAFSGNGCQWAGMALDAYHNDPVFHRRFREVCAAFAPWFGEDIGHLLESDSLAKTLDDTRFGQSLLFAIQVALSDALIARQIKPTVVFGHSVGEIAAAYCAECLSLEDAVAIVAVRSRHQHALAGEGKMAAVALSPDRAIGFARENGLRGIELGAVNTANSVTISGPMDEIKEYRAAARRAHIAVHILDIDYPFHHPAIDREREAFLRELPRYTPKAGNISFVSSVSGTILSGERLDANYWWSNVREVVQFAEAANVATACGANLFLEISPRPILTSYLTDNARQSGAAIAIVSTLNRPARNDNPLPHIFADAVAHGAMPWKECREIIRRSWVQLPNLPLDRIELRPPRTSDSLNLFDRQEGCRTYSLLGWRTDPNASTWKNHIDAPLFPDLAQHVVEGKSILPGSAFIEIAVAAARQFHAAIDVEVRNLEIIRPLELHSNRLRELMTILSPETGQIEIRSREYLSDDDWVTHALARIRVPVIALQGRVRHVSEALEASLSVTSRDAYSTAKLFGLDYGDTFQLLERARLKSGRYIEVDLRAPRAPAHPHVSYSLNPTSVDAAFHGLVALFSHLTQDNQGAPYIPVRFGSVRMGANHNEIRSAFIEIERMSPRTLKARIELWDDDGKLIATLDDCRFRRTSFKRQQNLETISYHYELVSKPLHPGDAQQVAPLAIRLCDEPISQATLLLDAAVYRACFDIARHIVTGTPHGDLSAFDASPDLRSYIANCFLILKDFGLATLSEGVWQVDTSTDLPDFDTIILELISSFPERGAAAALLNDVYRFVMTELVFLSAGGDISPELSFRHSDASLDHIRNHSPLARRRCEEICRVVEMHLSKAKSPTNLIIAEFAATSVAVTERLAAITDRFNANLVVFEDDENLRATLKVALGANPRVTIVEELGSFSRPISLAVSASGFLSSRTIKDGEMRAALQRAAECGAQLALLEHPSTVLSDFIFGLNDGWFDQTLLADMPIGAMLPSSHMAVHLETIGFRHVEARHVELADGPLVVLTCSGAPSMPEHDMLLPQANLLVIRGPGAELTNIGCRQFIDLSWTEALDAGSVENAVLELAAGEYDIVFALSPELPGKQAFQIGAYLDVLRHLVETVRASSARKRSVKPRLFLVAPGGASVGDTPVNPVNQAIWMYSRVLENEYDEIDVVRLDVDGRRLSDELWSDLLTLWGEGETELLFDDRLCLLKSLRVAEGSHPLSERLTSKFAAATVDQKISGRIDTILWQATDNRPEPQTGEVLVQVAATGLNFRDVMWAMGLLPEEALEDGFAGATIGMEFSGTALAVGPGVEGIKPGDAVMGIGPNAFSTHVVVSQRAVTRIPDGIDPVQAATVPVTFLTAYYALVELGRLQPDDTVLIHGAAGGVGLAALQIAKLKGATVIATAGTPEKRHLVATLGADQVYDSRSLEFVNNVLEGTGGEGVDIVVNSLFSEAMERSLELVKPFGRFLELGKRDYYSDRKIALRPFRKNISYFGIDADQLLVEAPNTTSRIFNEISSLFRAGHLRPLPHCVFAFDELSPAFRLMQSSGHIGKIVVTPPVNGRDYVLKANPGPLTLATGTYLVVGGIGGFGLEAANWVAEKGASHVALATRNGRPDAGTTVAIERWAKRGITASVHACDVTSEAQVAALLAELRLNGPLKGIIHAAMVLDDVLIANSSRERNQPVLDTKVAGATILDHLTDADDLELFLLFSSATTMVGNPGQANYVAANGYLEGLARMRRQRGKAALAVAFGAIADAGFLARNDTINEKLSRRIGDASLKARNALRYVEDYLRNDPGTPAAAVVVISEIDWRAASMLTTVQRSFFNAVRVGNSPRQNDADQIDLHSLLAGKPIEEVDRILLGLIASELATILRIAEQSVTPDKLLRDIGLDSLMTMELGTSFQQKTGIDLPLSGVSDTMTVGHVVGKLRDKLIGRDVDDTSSEEEGILESLASKHVETANDDVIHE